MKSKLEQKLINGIVDVVRDCSSDGCNVDTAERLAEHLVTEAQLDWISVADELPKNMQVVDVWSIHDPNAVGRYVNMTYEDFNGVMTFLSRPIGLLIPIEKATHWRPTPEPPEEQS